MSPTAASQENVVASSESTEATQNLYKPEYREAFQIAYIDGRLDNFYRSTLAPVGNTGVIGHSGLQKDEEKAGLVDWLTITWEMSYNEDNKDEWNSLLSAMLHTFGLYTKGLRKTGMNNFDKAMDLNAPGSYFAWGGETQRGRVMLKLSGAACAYVTDMRRVRMFCEMMPEARLTRVDVAFDDFDGEYSVDDVVESYEKGEFHIRGKAPSCECAGQWVGPNITGRTFYVGSRKSSKYLRAYEKGKQLGDPASKWVRHEIELKWEKTKPIPFDVLTDPLGYLAGSYPAYNWLSGRRKTIRSSTSKAKITLYKAVQEMKRIGGKLINVLCDEGMTDAQIIRMMRRPGAPARLLPDYPRYWGGAYVMA